MKLNVNDLAYYPVVLIWLFLNICLSSEVNSKFGSSFLLDGTQKYSGDCYFLVLLVVVALDNLSACNFVWWLVAINSTFCGLWITGEASWKPKIGQSCFTTQLLHTFSGRVRGYRMGEVSCSSSLFISVLTSMGNIMYLFACCLVSSGCCALNWLLGGWVLELQTDQHLRSENDPRECIALVVAPAND